MQLSSSTQSSSHFLFQLLPCLKRNSSSPSPDRTTATATEILTEQTAVKITPRPIHWSVYITGMGVLASISLIIYGIATVAFSFIFTGFYFFVSSIVGTYYTYSTRYLKTLEEFDETFSSIKLGLKQKDLEIQSLLQKAEALSHTFNEEQKQHIKAIKANNEEEKQLNAELIQAQTKLKKITDQFEKTQKEAALALSQKTTLFEGVINRLKDSLQSNKEQIASLEGTTAASKEALIQLKAHEQAAEEQLTNYKQLNIDYASENERLSKQINDLKVLLSQPDKNDLASDYAKQIKQLEAEHKDQMAKFESRTKQFNTLSTQISDLNQRLKSFS